MLFTNGSKFSQIWGSPIQFPQKWIKFNLCSSQLCTLIYDFKRVISFPLNNLKIQRFIAVVLTIRTCSCWLSLEVLCDGRNPLACHNETIICQKGLQDYYTTHYLCQHITHNKWGHLLRPWLCCIHTLVWPCFHT